MKLFFILCLISSVCFGNEDQSTKKEASGTVRSMVKEAKSGRKKKVEMCHDCGKPEHQCDCEGEEHKKK